MFLSDLRILSSRFSSGYMKSIDKMVAKHQGNLTWAGLAVFVFVAFPLAMRKVLSSRKEEENDDFKQE
jgi:hypothetical protein